MAQAQEVIHELEARLSAENLAKGGKALVLRDFQVRGVLQATCGQSQLCVQIAGAGMGKTTSALFTKEIFVSQGLRVLGVAPSNKAASGLGRELGIDATSMDRLLLDLEAGRQTLDGKTVVFVDEAGMAGFDVMEKLMGWAVKSGCKLILTGDPEQLPAVARGNVLRKLTEMEALVSTPDALLYLGRNLSDWNKISRQKHDWAKQASAFFSQGMVSQGLAEYEKRDCIHASMTAAHLSEDLAQAYLLDTAAPAQKLILATTNAQVKALNAAVRERLKACGKLHGSWKLPDSTLELSLGDRIVFKERIDGGDRAKGPDQGKDRKHATNSSGARSGKGKAGIAKNEFATVLSISRLADWSLDIQCQLDTPRADGRPQVVKLNSKVLGDVDHAFATTVHRSQGMTVDSVFAVAGSFLSKELFYVMATRHRERLQFHMLESDRAMVMLKATKNLDKLHGLDLQAADPELIRAEWNATARAGAGGGLEIVERLRASREKFLALMQKEKGRLVDWIRGQVPLTAQTGTVAQRNSWRGSKSLKLLRQLAMQRASLGVHSKQQDLGPVR
jgi:ATP-dependent exoDNAse (exonuclease V) alpha subunit